MPSVHYDTAIKRLQESIVLLGDDFSKVTLENRPIWKISSALIALSEALRDEFDQINAQLTKSK